MGRSPGSLSTRLLIGLASVSLLYWLAIALLTLRDSVDTVSQLFDAHLAQSALALLRLSDPDEADANDHPSPALQARSLEQLLRARGLWTETPLHAAARTVAAPKAPSSDAAPMRLPVVAGSIPALQSEYEKTLRYQVWGADGTLLLRSANAPMSSMASRDGYSDDDDAAGRSWRHFSVWDPHHDVRVVVSEAHDLRNRLVRGIALNIASPLALGLPVLVWLLSLSIRKGLRPLDVLADEIGRRKPDKLLPVDSARVPREVGSLVQALNALLARVSSALDGERRFTANAAHELRTPLAAMRLHLHVARGADSEDERQRALELLQQGVERSGRLVEQLLTLARLDPEQALPVPQSVDLSEVAQTVCAERAPLALQRDQTLELHADADLPCASGNADMLAMLLSNLVDNAIRYTQAGGHVDVAVRRIASGVQVEVRDDGPGIAPEHRARVFERFYRADSHEQAGTGLGLAICRRVADLHQAQIRLADRPDGRGLLVTVDVPGWRR
jgi:two-component system sensor histidine kinase QseC